jgi:hypothetical protein
LDQPEERHFAWREAKGEIRGREGELEEKEGRRGEEEVEKSGLGLEHKRRGWVVSFWLGA